ncbi:hypothetical protein GCK72_000887 [Caenorhabditis remanei]|uniref:Uncharacterized protein n=1 Tax=Caenorhabditis remanei TaxID=31234 RepID=A0A6A5HR31_CAERE|nr:hypothetical protein GCK72_000887 [Caenorhabditis remanei]KAF1769074.1 hypothetical protein GCK72_000887 [Caenorhabditis remanei]
MNSLFYILVLLSLITITSSQLFHTSPEVLSNQVYNPYHSYNGYGHTQHHHGGGHVVHHDNGVRASHGFFTRDQSTLPALQSSVGMLREPIGMLRLLTADRVHDENLLRALAFLWEPGISQIRFKVGEPFLP